MSSSQTLLVIAIAIIILLTIIAIFTLRDRYRSLLLEHERKINETKDQMLSIASHQLRTPATGVKQYLGLILDGYSDPISRKNKKIIEKAYRSNERQLKTINDVLYLARLGSGRIVTTNTKFDVSALLSDLLDELASDIKEKDHKVGRKIPRKSMYINADQHLFRMCLENLLTNAIKYTKPGGKINVRIECRDNQTEIEVSDNGVGIARSEMKELFKQFNRLPNELSQTTSGSGIGLYLAKKLIELQEGSIEVESTRGKGSTFTIKMPNC